MKQIFVLILILLSGFYLFTIPTYAASFCLPLVAKGATCSTDQDCQSGLYCSGFDITTNKNGICQPQVGNGEKCDNSGDGIADSNMCKSGLCSADASNNDICQSLADQGQSCLVSSDCKNNLYCNPKPDPAHSKCSPPVGNGQSCKDTGDNQECPSGQYCQIVGGVGTTCAPQLGDGSVCENNSDCQSGLFCKGAKADGTAGKCASPITAGAPCTTGDTCASGYSCNSSGALASPIPPNPCPDQNGVCTIIDTAVGSIDVSTPGAFVKVAFGVILSISGAIAILIIVFAGYGIMTSQGDPEKIKGAQEQLTSAIIGLLFMIFSVTILHIIGVDIFHLPGFLQ